MLRVGSDCSGIESPIQALKLLGIPFIHEFSSEINHFARQSILANYKPKILFNDITAKRKLPKLDLYICGFPCQPFSTAGKRLGENDPRGNIFLHCIKTIKQTDPSIFILENVKGITSIHEGTYFKKIMHILSTLTQYEINHFILNTRDYGIPQNRERLFIIGLKKSKIIRPLQIPKKIKCQNIHSFIDYSNTTKESYCKTYEDVREQFKDAVFASVGCLYSENNGKNKVDPRFSSTIISSCALWCITLQRKATIEECLRLQGFPKNFKQVVSDYQLRRQIGNSISVNVLYYLLKECFKSIKLL